jgi:hypothetical protein
MGETTEELEQTNKGLYTMSGAVIRKQDETPGH